MKIGQIEFEGRITAAIFEEGFCRPIPEHTVQQLIDRAYRDGESLAKVAAGHASKATIYAPPLLPNQPKEVWACGCTYEMSASFRDAEHGTREGFYRHVFTAPRPEIFYKGSARHCVGPDGKIGIREDSSFTAPEPELAVLLGRKGQILAYSLANDVSAWDIERENPLYLPQSKVYTACCAIGPWWVTADELTDPYSLDMSCTIIRGETVLFKGETSTKKLGRKIEHLIEYLMRANAVPSGSVLLTGTGIIVTQEAALAPGDFVSISATGIGTLSNETVLVS